MEHVVFSPSTFVESISKVHFEMFTNLSIASFAVCALDQLEDCERVCRPSDI